MESKTINNDHDKIFKFSIRLLAPYQGRTFKQYKMIIDRFNTIAEEENFTREDWKDPLKVFKILRRIGSKQYIPIVLRFAFEQKAITLEELLMYREKLKRVKQILEEKKRGADLPVRIKTIEDFLNYMVQNELYYYDVKPQVIFLNFAIRLQITYGLRWVSVQHIKIKPASRDEFKQIYKTYYRNVHLRKHIARKIEEYYYEYHNRIYNHTQETAEAARELNSNLVLMYDKNTDPNNFYFYWKGRRIEKFKANEQLIKEYETARIARIHYEILRVAQLRINMLRNNDITNFVKLFWRSFTDALIPYASQTYYEHVNKLIRNYLSNDDAKVGFHDFRRFFATYVYRKTHDVYLLKNLLRHSAIKDTLRYIKEQPNDEVYDKVFNEILEVKPNGGNREEKEKGGKAN